MGTQIHLGGVGADMGASAGAGFQKGVTQGLKQNREDQLLAQEQAKESAAAQEMIEATKAIYGAELDRQDNLMPDYDPGQATIVQTGLPAALGGNIPMFLNPTPNKGQEQIDGLGRAYAEGIQSFSDPKAAAVYTEAAVQSLDEAHAGFIKESLQGSISSAVQNGAVSEAQAAPFLEGIALDEDPRQVYQEWRQFANEQIEGRRDAARVERMAVGMDETTLSFKNQATGDPENAAWLNAQAKEMEDLAVWVREAAMYGHNDLDAQQVWKAYQDIKYRLNPEQKNRQDLELEAEKQKGRMALAKADNEARDRREKRSGLHKSLEAAMSGYGKDGVVSEIMGQLRALDEEEAVPPPYPAIPGVVATGQEANYDHATGRIGDAPPPQTTDKSTAQAADGSQAAQSSGPKVGLQDTLAGIEKRLNSQELSAPDAQAELNSLLSEMGYQGDGLEAWTKTLDPSDLELLKGTHAAITERIAPAPPEPFRDTPYEYNSSPTPAKDSAEGISTELAEMKKQLEENPGSKEYLTEMWRKAGVHELLILKVISGQ